MARSLPNWAGQPIYIIGGGPSLANFDFGLLRGKNTIGCNHAFRLGYDVCKMVVFCDAPFFHEAREGLRQYQGAVVTNHPALQLGAMGAGNYPDWLTSYVRLKQGVNEDPNVLAYNASTGAAAIHLALKMGGRPVYLLGYDMRGENNQNNWHPQGGKAKPDEVYNRHLEGLKVFARMVAGHYPGHRIVQLCTGPGLGLFEVEDLASHFVGALDAKNLQPCC
jgi:hypothetical protein